MSALADEIEQAVRKVLREELPRILDRGSKVSALDPNRGLSVAEAAIAAHRVPDTIRRAIKAGDLKASKPGGGREWIIAPADLDAWLGRQRRDQKVVDLAFAAEQALARAMGGRR